VEASKDENKREGCKERSCARTHHIMTLAYT
jgi:hypothetical protein